MDVVNRFLLQCYIIDCSAARDQAEPFVHGHFKL